jgi:hypothetical protein
VSEEGDFGGIASSDDGSDPSGEMKASPKITTRARMAPSLRVRRRRLWGNRLVRRWLGSFGSDDGVGDCHASSEDGSVPSCRKKSTWEESPGPTMARALWPDEGVAEGHASSEDGSVLGVGRRSRRRGKIRVRRGRKTQQSAKTMNDNLHLTFETRNQEVEIMTLFFLFSLGLESQETDGRLPPVREQFLTCLWVVSFTSYFRFSRFP